MDRVFLGRVAYFLLGVCPALAQTDAGEQFFETRIRPLFAARCYSCHGPGIQTAGLDLSTGEWLRKGPGGRPLVLPGDAANSRLLQVVGYRERIQMPPGGKLADAEISALRQWVEMGAPWPRSGPQSTSAQHWSFRPVQLVPPPQVKNEAWVRSPVDRFILARLEQRGLMPAPAADKLTLIRRATYDLTGLPPTAEAVRDFLTDSSPGAFEKVVDRLLASPRYGERWGRHWLDIARYGDSTGVDEDRYYPYAWRYRDYVIEAFNQDLPYDQFIRQQIAGDLAPPGPDGNVNTKGIVATGFLALGPKLLAEQDKTKVLYDIIDEQIDVTGKAILGLTLSCARCHDHKFDPISIRDYYSLASIFASTKQLAKLEGIVSELYFAPLVPRDVAMRYESHQKKVEEKKREIDELTSDEARMRRDALAPGIARYMLAARKVSIDKVPVADVATELSLDASLLKRWVEYLKPTNERKPHLEAWFGASRETAETIAAQYQSEFIATAEQRNRALADWKLKSAAARQRGEEPPPAPRFQPGENRFFTEVSASPGPLALAGEEKEKNFSAAGKIRFDQLNGELKQLKDASPPTPPFACAVAEGEPVEQRVFLRGNHESRGDVTPKRLPIALAGENQPPVTSGSGRRELAAWLADPRNPLTARVMVNRIWQGHFGEGIVRTPSNFGLTGEPPSHPELLDWLAAEFLARGWSVKAMHRIIMASSAYQMSSEASAEQREKDAGDRLLSRFPMRRLTVEEIRDSLLALDGSLDFSMGGSLLIDHTQEKEFSEGRKSLSPEATKRRSVYLPLRRANLASMYTLFDFGDASTSTEARTQTNVAPQALFMMNSAFVAERTQSLARNLLSGYKDNIRRIEGAWLLALGRQPQPMETQRALEYLERFPAKPENVEGPLLAWASLCRALVASNDFIYVH